APSRMARVPRPMNKERRCLSYKTGPFWPRIQLLQRTIDQQQKTLEPTRSQASMRGSWIGSPALIVSPKLHGRSPVLSCWGSDSDRRAALAGVADAPTARTRWCSCCFAGRVERARFSWCEPFLQREFNKWWECLLDKNRSSTFDCSALAVWSVQLRRLRVPAPGQHLNFRGSPDRLAQ